MRRRFRRRFRRRPWPARGRWFGRLCGLALATLACVLPGQFAWAQEDTVLPTVISVTIESRPQTGDTYGIGESIEVDVWFSETVFVREDEDVLPALEIALDVGFRMAPLVSGGGTPTLRFRYAVAPGDWDTDGISIANLAGALQGGIIEDASQNSATRESAVVPASPRHKVDGVTPEAETVTIRSRPADSTRYRPNERIELEVLFSEVVYVTAGQSDLALLLGVGGELRHAAYVDGSGTSTLKFAYIVQPGDLDEDGVDVGPDALVGGTIQDLAGNRLTDEDRHRLRPWHPDAGHRVGVSTGRPFPARVDIVSSPAEGSTYGIGEFIDVHVAFTAPVFVLQGDGCAAGLPVLQLAISESSPDAEIHAGSGTDTLWFRYQVQPGDFDEDGISVSAGRDADTGSLTGGCIEDAVGDAASRVFRAVPAQSNHRVDGVAPDAETARVVSRPVAAGYGLGETIEMEVAFSEVVHVADAEGLVLRLSVGASTREADYVEGSGTDTLSFAYVVVRGDFDDDGIDIGPDALVGGTIQDVAGNVLEAEGRRRLQPLPAQSAHKVDAALDAAAPRVEEPVTIVSTPSGAAYANQEVVRLEVRFNEIVHVSGTPQLAISVGRQTRNAAFLSGSGTRTLTFAYVVVAGDFDADGIAVAPEALTGGTIEDAAGNAADRYFDGLPANANHRVDARVDATAAISAVRIASNPGVDGVYVVGDRIEVRVSFTRPVLVVDDVTLLLTVGAETRVAALVEGGGTDTLTFAYEVLPGDRSAGVSVPANAVVGGQITDLAGNAAVRVSPGLTADARHQVDGGLLSVVSVRVVSDPGVDQTYAPGDAIAVAVQFNAVVHVSGAPLLTLLIGGVEREVRLFDGSGTTTLVFRYVVQEGEYDGDGISISDLAQGTIADRAGNPVNRTFESRREPSHRVGAEFALLLDPPVTVDLGSETAIDVRAALEEVGVNFVGRYGPPVVEDESIAGARVIGHVVTVAAVSEGSTLVAVPAVGVPLTIVIPVQVRVSVAERAAIEDGMAAFGRGLLMSHTDTVARRLELARRGGAARGYRANATGQGMGWNGVDGPLFDGLSGGAPGRPGSIAPGGGLDDGLAQHGHGHGHGWSGPSGDIGGGAPFGRIFSMELSGSGTDPVSWGVWGGADSQTFEGALGAGDYNGDMQSVHLGIDAKGQDWVAGASVSRTRADVSYRFGTDGVGAMEAQLNTVSPYVQWAPNERATVWTVLGLGTGELRRREEAKDGRAPANLSSRLGLVGGRLHVGGAGGVKLALRGDAGMVQLETDEGLRGIDALAVNAQRFRAGVEASWPVALMSGELVPFVDIGARWDGGDGATGEGAEVAGGIRYRGPLAGLEVRGRSLVQHGAADTEESGVAATIFIEPNPQGRGWQLSLSPRLGAAEWTDRFSRPARALAASERRVGPEWQWQTRIGYGFAMQRRPGTLTPFSELYTAGREGRRARLGIAYEMAGGDSRSIRLQALSEVLAGGRAAEDERRVLVTAEARF